MNELQALLDGKLKPGIYLLENNLEVNAIRRMAEQGGYNFFYLDGRKISNEEEFFREAETVYAFPYFGKNWNALDDCLRDMSWLPRAKGNITLYDDFQRFARLNADDFQRAYYVLRYATRTDTTPQPMYVFLRGDESRLPLPDIDGRLLNTNTVE